MPVLALAVVGAACSSGVSEEEFEALRQDLATEREKSQSLESQLAQERSEVADLQQSVEEAEVREALLATFLAWNRKDADGFVAGFTDRGVSESLLFLPESIGQLPIALRRVMDTTVSGNTATVHVMFALGTQRSSVRQSMVKQDGVWKIDGEERLSPGIQSGTTTVDLQIDECTLVSESNAVTSANVAFRVENVGKRPHHFMLNRVPEGLDLMLLLHGDGSPHEGIEDVAFVDSLEPGEQINVAFTKPLAPGRYVLLCFRPNLDDPQGLPHIAAGIVAEFTVH